MCLGHVYIFLEPIRSARLTFGDDRYYEFMCFDEPKVVRSPGCDHGHDEEISKWSRHKDRYIGSLYLDIGSVPGEIRILPEYREVTGTPWEPYGPS